MTGTRRRNGENHRFLLTCLLRGMTRLNGDEVNANNVSTHMPLARHDANTIYFVTADGVSTHMPLARHDRIRK